jgi:hypothetical protein
MESIETDEESAQDQKLDRQLARYAVGAAVCPAPSKQRMAGDQTGSDPETEGAFHHTRAQLYDFLVAQ